MAWGDEVADAPTGKAVGFGEGEQRDRVRAAFGQGSGREVPRLAVGEIFVGLVSEVVERPVAAEPVDGGEVVGAVDSARGVVGRDGDDGAGVRGDGCGDGVKVELVVGISVDEHRSAVGHADCHFVVEVERRHDDDFVAGVGYTDDASVLAAALVAVSIYIDEDIKRQAESVLARWWPEDNGN